MGYKVAVVGATGNVGREMLDILAERAFPADEVVALASRRSQGVEISFGDKTLKAKTLDTYDFSDVDLCLMSAGGEVSKEWSPQHRRAGRRRDRQLLRLALRPGRAPRRAGGERRGGARLQEEGHHRQPELLDGAARRGAEAAARPRPIKRVVVATYQSVSGAGKDGMDELDRQTKALYSLQEVEQKKFPKRIAFNLIPHIDVFMEDGFTKEEWKMMAETKKILDPKIKLTATCVRVPVFIGHSEAVNVEFEKPITADEAREILRSAPGVVVIDKREPGGYITPHEAAGEDATYVSRIREDITVENGLAFWCVSDNLRKGAALNAVQIAEALVNRGLLQAKRKAA